MTDIKDVDPKENIEKKIRRQIEHYFGDFNLPKDSFLLEKTKENDGWVSIDTMLLFHRLKALSQDEELIIKSLASSLIVEVDETNKKIRRIPSKPLPEYNDERKKELGEMTVYVKGFDKNIKDIQVLIDFFDDFDGVLNVNMRNWSDKKNKKETEKHFKGSVFVTFTSKDFASKFMNLSSLANKSGDELIRLWQNDYFAKKAEELAEKRKSKNENKQKIKDSRASTLKEKEEVKMESSLPKGTVLIISGLNDSTSREDIKEKLKDVYKIQSETIAYMYYQKGENIAKLRFKEENGAVEALSSIQSSKEPLSLRETLTAVSILSGDEEESFLKQCLIDIQERKNKGNGGHKRRGGFSKGGGRGRKRPRN